MKKVIAVLILAVGFTVTTQAQRGNKEGHEELTVEQQTELAVKKMTLKLDLTASQQNQLRPLIAKQVAERQEMRAKRKAMKESGSKPTSEERYAMKNKMLDKQIAYKADMKRILNKKQYERFEKMSARKMHKYKKRAEHRKHKKEELHKEHMEEK